MKGLIKSIQEWVDQSENGELTDRSNKSFMSLYNGRIFKSFILMPVYFKLSIYRSRYTWSTGAGTRKGSRKARGVRSWLRQSAKCARIDSTEWRGCCRVTRKYFCSARAKEGNTAWAASCGSIGIAGTVSKQPHAVNTRVMFQKHKTYLFCEKWIQKRQGLIVT